MAKQARDQDGHFVKKPVKPYSPAEAEKAANSDDRLREEITRVNRALARVSSAPPC